MLRAPTSERLSFLIQSGHQLFAQTAGCSELRQLSFRANRCILQAVIRDFVQRFILNIIVTNALILKVDIYPCKV
ncbi:hypothetical protein CD006_17690 [Enterobacter sp. 10-1]|nr:hypothetical protein CD006_17690 [Enterobacter sp. 10-1]